MKIGIIGSDNSHAAVFAKALNIEQLPEYEGIEISHIWGLDSIETKDKVEKGKIKTVCKNSTDMIGVVDAAILVLRHGGLHHQYATPFLEAKVPLFIDKPLSTTTKAARGILNLIEKYQVPVTSFSTVRYDSTIQNMKTQFDQFGKITSGDVAGIITSSSAQFGGMIFYGIHITELMLEIFGYGVETIYASIRNDNTIAIATYKDAIVTMHFMGQSSYLFSATIHGKEKSIYQNADAGDYFKQGLKRVIQMFQSGKSNLSYAQLFEPVAIHAAIEESLKTNQEVKVEKL